MWKAYTREKPARPGWAVACMALAFVGTLALAQMQIADATVPDWKTERTVELEDWSIALNLPAGFNWDAVEKDMSLSDWIRRSLDTSSVESHTFTGTAPKTGTVTVSISMLRDATDPTAPIQTLYGPPDGRLDKCVSNGPYWYLDGRAFRNSDFKVIVLPDPNDNRLMIIDVSSDKSPQYNSWIAQWITESISCP